MQTIAFLDTEICKISTDISIKVFRKNTHTDKYLDFGSHSPVRDKIAVVKSLLDRARIIPSNQVLQKEETDRVAEVLELNAWIHTRKRLLIVLEIRTKHNKILLNLRFVARRVFRM